MSISKETEAKLQAEHGEVHILEASGVTIAVKNPSAPSFDRFMSTSAAKKENAHKALGQLVRDCLVFPTEAEYDAALVRLPGLAVTFGSEVMKIAGLVDEVDRKKLGS